MPTGAARSLPSANEWLRELIGRELRTLTGHPNRVLDVRDTEVVVATDRSPDGRPVPTTMVQDALDQLGDDGEVLINVQSVGHRSAFVGAVLRELPMAQVEGMRIRLLREQPPASPALGLSPGTVYSWDKSLLSSDFDLDTSAPPGGCQ